MSCFSSKASFVIKIFENIVNVCVLYIYILILLKTIQFVKRGRNRTMRWYKGVNAGAIMGKTACHFACLSAILEMLNPLFLGC